MQNQKKELECLIKVKGIDESISEFGKMGMLDSDNPDCFGCCYLSPFGFGNGAPNNYCTNPEIIRLYQEIHSIPCQNINLDSLIESDKTRIRLLFDKMALEEPMGEEYKKIKREFLDFSLELLRKGIKPESIRSIIHTYNNIRLVKEIELPKEN